MSNANPRVLWISGAFGSGKTTAANRLSERMLGSRIFDPEEVGFMLRHVMTHEPMHNFQDWPAWRLLVASAVGIISREVSGPIVIPMTFSSAAYAEQIFAALASDGVSFRHFVLDVERTELERRIAASAEFPDDAERSERVREWRRAKIAESERVRHASSGAFDVIDTTHLDPDEVATAIESRITQRKVTRRSDVAQPVGPHRPPR